MGHAGDCARPSPVVGHHHTNLAGVNKEDGSLVGLWRAPAPMFGPRSGKLRQRQWASAMRPVRASNWRGPSTLLGNYWVQPSIDLFPLGAATTLQGLEDPFLWKDKSGVYHAVMSNGLYHAGAATRRVDAHATHELARRAGWKPFAGLPHLVMGRDGFTRLTGACYTLTSRYPLGM